MALRGTLTHRKTRRLGKALGIPACFALGLLEALWHVTAEQAPDGAIGRMSDDDIAMEMFYDGDATKLVEALVVSELVELHPVHRLIVHDWHLHSDDAADLRLARARKYYAGGQRPRMNKLSSDQKKQISADYDRMESGEDGRSSSSRTSGDVKKKEVAMETGESVRICAHISALPEPEPEPVPDSNTPPTPSPARGRVEIIPIREPDVSAESPLTRRAVRRAIAESGEAGLWTAAVDQVMLAMDSGDRKLRDQVQLAMYGAVLKAGQAGSPQWPDEVADRMTSSWRRLNVHGGLMRYRVAALSFIASGMWAEEDRWPWDEQAVRRGSEARIGIM